MKTEQARDLERAQEFIARAEGLLEGVMESLPTPGDEPDPTFDAVQDAQQAAYGLLIQVSKILDAHRNGSLVKRTG